MNNDDNLQQEDSKPRLHMLELPHDQVNLMAGNPRFRRAWSIDDDHGTARPMQQSLVEDTTETWTRLSSYDIVWFKNSFLQTEAGEFETARFVLRQRMDDISHARYRRLLQPALSTLSFQLLLSIRCDKKDTRT